MATPTKAEIKDRQETLNTFSSKWLKGVKPLRVDGVSGKSTRSRILMVKWYIGYGKKRDVKWSSELVRRLRHPNDAQYFPKGMIGTGKARRRRQKAEWAANQVHAIVTPGVTRYNGVTVAKWMVPYLNWAKQHGWDGWVVSGWRAPWYSRSLCIRMCGRPSCPGKCAGEASNHSGSAPPRGALDVAHYAEFGELMRRCPLRPVIFNALGARDPVHFSASGN